MSRLIYCGYLGISVISRPGISQGAALQTSSSFTDSISESVTLSISWLYGAAMPKQLKMMLPVIKLTMLHKLRTFLIVKDM